ncbi:MAG: trypsin-like peptidase domain-containing protein [Candidatus Saccharimonadales bacterium]
MNEEKSEKAQQRMDKVSALELNLSSKAQTTTSPSPKDVPFVPSERRRTRFMQVALLLIVVLGLGFGGGWLGAVSRSDQSVTSVTQQKTILTSKAAVVSSIAKDMGQSVVSVDVTGQAEASSYDSLFGYGGSGAQTQRSAGTGMILTSGGLIMTNRHVVPSGTTSVSVTLSDGTVFDDVKVVGRTADSSNLDVAFLQIQDTKGKKLVPIKLGDSSKVKVGDPVVAIGNALGQFQNTVTSGIISGYGRSVQASSSSGSDAESLTDLFQTDAAINEGNSGGPLADLNGEVIGMNTAMASDSQNIGFSIPINDLKGLISSVEQSGKLQLPYLGVMYIPITRDVAEQYNLTVTQGAYIPKEVQIGEQTVLPNGPAAKSGVKGGDVITAVDGVPVNQSNSLTSVLGKHKVGDKVPLTINRAGKTITINVTLGSAPTSN